MAELTQYDPAVWEYVTVQKIGKAGPDQSHRVRIRRKRQVEEPSG